MSEELTERSPSELVALALQQQADPDVLKKLLELQERWDANQAKKAYVSAMTAFKQEAPAVLKKHNKVDFTSAKGRTHYNYANLGSIVQGISALLGKHELSASWSTEQKANIVTVTCNITHVGGHRESVTLSGPIDESGNKNLIQAVGSTVTYLQRYTLLAALGLATIDQDDDGRQGSGGTDIEPPKQKSSGDPAAPAESITTTVKEIFKKEGPLKDGKPSWVKWTIDTEAGKFNTFDANFGALALDAKNGKLPVVIGYKDKGQYGKEIESFEIEVPKGEPEGKLFGDGKAGPV